MTVQLTINGQPVQAQVGETLLAAARRQGLEIPTLCHIQGLAPLDTCLVCVVEVEGHGGLLPACSTRVQPDMRVQTESPRIASARRGAMELILSEHQGECRAPCELACPAGWNIAEFMERLQQDEVAAAQQAWMSLALPATLGHVCDAPCERACRRDELDRPLHIRRTHRDLNLQAVRWTAPPTGPQVAVAGSGPAGLAAALRLAELGYAVTVFEQAEELGGSLRAMLGAELPAAALQADLDALRRTGTALVVRQAWTAGTDAHAMAPYVGAVLATGQRLRGDGPEDGTVVLAGAAAGVQGSIIRAIAQARRAADRLDLALRQRVSAPEPVRLRYRELSGHDQAAILRTGTSAQDVLPRQDWQSAAAEAQLCLFCGCHGHDDCRLRRVATQLGADAQRFVGARRPFERDASHPLVVYESHKCILCQACVQLSDGQLAVIRRGFLSKVAAPFDGPWGQHLDNAAALACAEACPSGAISKKLLVTMASPAATGKVNE